MGAKPDEQPPRRRRRWKKYAIAVAAVVVVGVAVLAWTGPSALLRWAVRTADSSLSLEVGSAAFRAPGHIELQNVALFLRGREEPILRAERIVAGLGREWRRGRFGSLLIEGPVVSLDREALAHWETDDSSGGGGGRAWEFGRVEIRRGHVWLSDFGEPAMDISMGVDGVLERVGPGAVDQEHKLDLGNVYVAVHQGSEVYPLFGAGLAEVRITWGGLQERSLAGLRVEQGWLLAGAGLEALSGGGKDGGEQSAGGSFVLESLDLVDLQVHTGEVSAGLPELTLRVNAALRDVGLGAAAEDLTEQIHQVEFSDIEILSPYDPLQRAVSVRSVFVHFSLAGLARREIHELTLLGPTIYVGEALFQYMRHADDEERPPEPVAATEGWMVRRLDINFGRLIIAVGGRSQIGLPLAFQARADNVSLSSLAGLNLNLVMTIPPDDYDFPDYELAFENVRGDLRLNFPPQEETNNLVNVVKIDRGRWRNFSGSDLWVSVTFDLEGINGQFGGEAYRGYVSGGFSFFLQPESPWTGWISATDLDLDDLTQAAAPQHFVMSGRADMKLEVNGNGPEVDRVLGSLNTKGRGRMVVNKLNDLLEALPPEWSSLRRGLTRIGLETLRDFDYTKAGADFWFVGREGKLDVKMQGPSGSRNFEVVLHGRSGDAGQWSQRKVVP